MKLQKKIGVVQQTYAGYESGKHEPNLEIMIRLANIYRTSMDYITGRYWGVNEESLAEEEYYAEQNLEQLAMHYEIQHMQNIEFMKMVNNNAEKINNSRLSFVHEE